MPRQIINVGTAPNDGTGDTIRASFTKLNDMTGEIYPVIDNPIAYSRLPTGAGTWDVGSGNVLTVTRQPNLVAGLAVGGTEVISSARALANVTANASIITAGTLGVARGGTGVADPVSGNLLVGAGASAMTALAPGAAAGYVRSNGSAWVRSAILAADLPAHTHSLTADVTGILPSANGGTGLSSPTANRILLTGGASAMSLIAPTTSGTFVRANGTTWAAAAIATSDLGTGTANSTTFLRGDLTWQTVGGVPVGQAAYLSANQELPGGGQYADQWFTAVLNTTEWGTGFLNAGTGVFTVPSGQGGTYRIEWRFRAGLPTRVLLNGTTEIFWEFGNEGRGSKTRVLAAGNTLQIQAKHNGGFGITFLSGITETWLVLTRVGDS
jgi:hypothetical protein